MYTYNSRTRYHLVRDYNLLTSWPVLSILLTATITATVSWFIMIFLSTVPSVIAATIITTSLFAGALLVYVFGSSYYPNVKPLKSVLALKSAPVSQQDINVASAASFSLLRALGSHSQRPTAKSLAASLNHLILSTETRPILRRLGLDPQRTANLIVTEVAPQLSWSQFAKSLLDVAAKHRRSAISPAHALGAVLMQPSARAYLREHEVTSSDLDFIIWWEDERLARLAASAWWRPEQLLSHQSLGTSWAAGYTPFVDRFARLPRGSFWDDNIYGHEEKLTALINSLARQRQSNVLLVGDPGVGRLGLVRALASRLRTDRAHLALRGQRLIYLNIGELIAAGSTGATQLGNVALALREMEAAGNVITVIGGLSSILGSNHEHNLNLTDILVPFLSSGTVRSVVMITTSEYHLRLKSNDQLSQYFEVLLLPSLSVSGTLKRLALSLPAIERAAKVFVPLRTLRACATDTESLLPHIPYPERAFDFLEEAIVLAQSSGASVVLPEHVHTVIARKIGINLGHLRTEEKQRLLKLPALMHKRLVNQEQAVATLARAMTRARTQTRSLSRPIGTFLFLGPTGVGKTEAAKTLAAIYFGAERFLTRLDMSEFQSQDGASRLIGSAEAPVGRLTSLISDQPYTVLLLDEFEKASRAVHQIFLQVLDEGHLTDYAGRRFSFQHAIIIATSNAGSELIRTQARGGTLPANFAATLKEHILKENILTPELLNRFDDVITFTPLTPDHIRQIARLMLGRLNQRLDSQHGITVNISAPLVNYLVKIGYNPEFGARPLNRAIQDTVEFAVAQLILRGHTQPGQVINLSPEYLTNLKG